MPSQNIAVLGAGIMGLSAAYALLRAGHNITLYDPEGFPGQNSASAMAGGMLAPWSEIEHLPGRWLDAAVTGLEFWRDADIETGLAQNGSLLLAHTEDRHMLERFKAHLPAGVAQKGSNEPALTKHFPDTLYIAEEAHLDPAQTLRSLAKAIEDMGGRHVPETCTPEAISDQYDHIIDCRGMAAADDLPDLRGVKGETAIVQNPDFTLSRTVRLMHPRYPLYIVPRSDNVFMIGATIIESEQDTQVSLRSAMELMSAAYSLHPSFGDAKILSIQAGIRPAYPDNLPRLTTEGNIIRANGLFRHGYLLSPMLASAIAKMITGQDHEYLPLFTGGTHEDHHQRPDKNHRHAA